MDEKDIKGKAVSSILIGGIDKNKN